MLYTLNLYGAVCQLYLNKTGREKKRKIMEDKNYVNSKLNLIGKKKTSNFRFAAMAPWAGVAHILCLESYFYMIYVVI